MIDIDSCCKKFTGSDDYMKKIADIVGDISRVDEKFYIEQASIMSANNKKILICLNNLIARNPTQELEAAKTMFVKAVEPIDFKNAFREVKKKSKRSGKVKISKEITRPYKPITLFESDWFKSVKFIEREIAKVLGSLLKTDKTKLKDYDAAKSFIEIQAIFKSSPEIIDIKRIFDIRLTDQVVYSSFINMQRSCREIINIILTPMYSIDSTLKMNAKKLRTIYNNFDAMNEKMGLENTSPLDVNVILKRFVIAKYRSTITGNSKHYVKMFIESLDSEEMADMEPAQFLEVVESLNVEAIGSTDKVYKFTQGAKSIMKEFSNRKSGPIDGEKLIQRLNEIFEVPEENNDMADDGETSDLEDMSDSEIEAATTEDFADILA